VTVADITARQFHGDYAGLAACKTAVGGVDLLDEAITLAAALHYTGYRHVIAALWSIETSTSAAVFEALYQDIIEDGTLKPDRAAVALHPCCPRDAGPRTGPAQTLDTIHPHRSLTVALENAPCPTTASQLTPPSSCPTTR
jgi:hypothetical protein